MKLIINVDALDKTSAAVKSATDLTEVDCTELLVTGNRIPVVIEFTSATFTPPAWVTDDTYQVDLGLGVPSVDGVNDYASTANLAIDGNTRTGALNLATAALRSATYWGGTIGCNFRPVGAGVPSPRRYPLTLEVRVTTPDGFIETLGLIRFYVVGPILPASPVDQSNAAPLTVLYDPATGLLIRPGAIQPENGGMLPGGTPGQALVKASNDDFALVWTTIPGLGGGLLNKVPMPAGRNSPGADGDYAISGFTFAVYDSDAPGWLFIIGGENP